MPSTMDCVVMYIMAVNPTLKMAFWPKLRADSDVCVWIDARWNFFNDSSSRVASWASLENSLTVS